MKSLFYACFIALIVSACASSKNYLERSNEDKALIDAIKKLSKNPLDENAIQAVPILYTNVRENRLAKIKDLKNDKEIDRWDNIINEYQHLQNAYDAIINNSAAFKLVNAQSYNSELFEMKQAAAEAYYQNGQMYLDKANRSDAKKSTQLF